MYKLDPILKDFNLDISKTSKNYIEMKAMLEKFEKEYIHNQNTIIKIKL